MRFISLQRFDDGTRKAVELRVRPEHVVAIFNVKGQWGGGPRNTGEVTRTREILLSTGHKFHVVDDDVLKQLAAGLD